MPDPKSSTADDGEALAGTKTKKPAEIWLRVSWCKGCALCVDYCKPGVLEMKGTAPIAIKLDKCTRCRMCEAVCPDFAIEIDPMDETGIKKDGIKL